MNAQRLRDAAALLRERGEVATVPPWRAVEGASGCWWVEVPSTGDVALDLHGENATYIATMHPGVGLALADWLDASARDLDWWEDLNKRHGVECSCCDNCGRCAEMSLAAPDGDAPALHARFVADLILGGTP